MKIVSNLIWRFLERAGAQLISFVVSVILARLLAPELYGTIALVTVFTNIMQVFIDSGMGNALIQKKDADDLDFSSVFFFNITMCLGLYGLMFVGAPLISAFYDMPELIPVIRVLSLTLVASGVKNIQQAYISKNLLFKRFFFSTMGGTFAAAVVGVGMAIYGFGIWALVAQHLTKNVVDMIILWFTVKWRPKLQVSVRRLKDLFSFGWKLLLSSLIDVVYNDLRQLIIGKLYTSSDLAQYNRGKQLPHLIITNINTSIDSVLLPTMAAEQDNQARVRGMTRRAIKTSTYIMAPLMLGMAAVAEPMVRLLLTEKWLPSVPYMRIFCITYVFYPIHTANLNAIKAMGRSDLFLKLEIAKKIVGVTVLGCTMWFGVKVMAYSLLFTSVTSQIINSWPNRKLLEYSYFDQLRDILPAILLAAGMGFCVSFVPMLGWMDYVTLGVQILLGAIIYILGSMLLQLEAYRYILQIVKSLAGKFLH